jgi:L-cysteine desulfidase
MPVPTKMVRLLSYRKVEEPREISSRQPWARLLPTPRQNCCFSRVYYRRVLQKMNMTEVLALVDGLDEDDRAYLWQGVEMNLIMSELGYEVGGTAHQLRLMQRDNFLADAMFIRTKLRVASAVDARMAGMSHAVMTSGGSGNQGVVTILTPYTVGREMGVDGDRIIESIAVAHLVNAYIKCFLGEISVICGCAMAAGIASATAIVYQRAGIDIDRITLQSTMLLAI